MAEKALPKELFNILACPACKGDLKYTEDNKSLSCAKCKVKYPIKRGIPLLLPPEQKKAK